MQRQMAVGLHDDIRDTGTKTPNCKHGYRQWNASVVNDVLQCCSVVVAVISDG